jgi:hypothetical protein
MECLDIEMKSGAAAVEAYTVPTPPCQLCDESFRRGGRASNWTSVASLCVARHVRTSIRRSCNRVAATAAGTLDRLLS